MALDDFAPQGTKTVPRQSVAPEDEDLFDFPVIEMVLETEKPAERRTVGEVAATVAAPAPTAAPAPAAKPASTPAPAAQPAAAASTPAPAKSTTTDAKPTAAKPAAATQAKPASAKSASGDVKQAAELIDGLETVLEDDLEDSRLARRGPRTVATSVRNGSPAALLGGMLLLNLLTFAFFWYASASFRDGIQGLRDDLVLATRANSAAQRVEPARDPHAVDPSGAHAPIVPGKEASPDAPTPETEHGAEGSAHSASSTPANTPHAEPRTERSTEAHPLAAFEQTTLDLARQEIEAGEVLAARKRLYRLLALADRIDTELRADVEARARFLIADSYRSQAEAKEAKHAEDAAASSSRVEHGKEH